MSIKSLPLNLNAISSKAVPVSGTADINQDGSVDLRLKTTMSSLGMGNSRAEAAAEALEPIVPHYLNITQQYNLPTKQGQKFYTWAGKPGAAPQSRLGDYNVREFLLKDIIITFIFFKIRHFYQIESWSNQNDYDTLKMVVT